MHTEESLKEIQKQWHGDPDSYAIGLALSLLCTLASFSLVIIKIISEEYLLYTVVVLALVQAGIQLYFFFHVGKESKPRWDKLVFYFMMLVILIIALGSIWIMFDLYERVMPHKAVERSHD